MQREQEHSSRSDGVGGGGRGGGARSQEAVRAPPAGTADQDEDAKNEDSDKKILMLYVLQLINLITVQQGRRYHPPEEEMKLQRSQNVAEQELDLPFSAAAEFLNFDDKNGPKFILYISLGKNIHKYKCE